MVADPLRLLSPERNGRVTERLGFGVRFANARREISGGVHKIRTVSRTPNSLEADDLPLLALRCRGFRSGLALLLRGLLVSLLFVGASFQISRSFLLVGSAFTLRGGFELRARIWRLLVIL